MKNGKIFLFCFILIVLMLLLYLFKDFLLVIAIASLMAVATANLQARALKLTKNRRVMASLITTLFIVLLFFAPLIYAVFELAKILKNYDANTIISTFNFIKSYEFALPDSLSFLQPKINEFLASIDLNNASKQILNYASSFTKSGAKFIIDMFLICVFYFFANLYGTELVIYLKSVVPLSKDEFEDVLSEVGNVMSVVLYSMVFNALFQGTLFAIIMGVFGYDAVFMGILFAVSSLIPAIGGALVYVPISLYELAIGNEMAAIWIFGYAVIVISFTADTLIKPLIIKWINQKLVKTPAKINEFLIFLAMIAGISSFGFWGIILGPAILTFFISTIRMSVILKSKKLI